MEKEFLLEEVRNGFLVPAVIKQAWAADIEVLMEIDRVCKLHDIQYFADWGTLLGAVRHGGFIPWDDDLDIVMKREDYIKFMTIARFDMQEGFGVQSFRTEDDCWLFMAKVVGRNHICFEKEHLRRFYNFPYIASVDIFVLDYVHRDAEEEEKRRTICKYMIGVADEIIEKKVNSQEKETKLRILEDIYGKKIRRIDNPIEMGRYLYAEIEEIFAQVPKESADKLTQLFPGGLKGSAFQFPKEFYENAVYLPFEYFKIPVPIAYDRMLKMRYGDYIWVFKDAGAHNYPFFEGQKKNLMKVLDIPLNEFKLDEGKLFRGKIESESKNDSYKVLVREAFSEIQILEDIIVDLLQKGEIEALLGHLETSQQLNIDVGNLLERMFGDDNEIIPILSQYCEILYLIYSYVSEAENFCDEMGQENHETNSSLVERLIKQGMLIEEVLNKYVFSRKLILFLPVLSKDWTGFSALWEQTIRKSDVDVAVMPLPYYYKDYDGSAKEILCDLEGFPEEVALLDYKTMSPEYLELLHPEEIYIQNAYDNWHPNLSVAPMYYSEQLRMYTDRLVYVQPKVMEEFTQKDVRAFHNQRYYLHMPGVVYADTVIVQSENIKMQCIESLVKFAGENTRNVWEERVVSIDDVTDKYIVALDEEEIKRSYKKILYGISFGTVMEDIELTKNKILNNLGIFTDYKDELLIDVLFYPNDENMFDLRMWLTEAIKGVMNVRIIDEKESVSCQEYDAFYGDIMPVVLDFKKNRKPVMIQNIFL